MTDSDSNWPTVAPVRLSWWQCHTAATAQRADIRLEAAPAADADDDDDDDDVDVDADNGDVAAAVTARSVRAVIGTVAEVVYTPERRQCVGSSLSQ